VPLLSGSVFPTLKYLGLRNGQDTDELVTLRDAPKAHFTSGGRRGGAGGGRRPRAFTGTHYTIAKGAMDTSTRPEFHEPVCLGYVPSAIATCSVALSPAVM
jgi:hypothetical protein